MTKSGRILSEIGISLNVFQKPFFSVVDNALPCRGDNEVLNKDSCGNTGNFLAALEVIANHDDILKRHLDIIQLSSSNITYMSPLIQDEILEIIGQDVVLKNLLEEIKAAKLCSIMADEVTSHNKEQLALFARFIDKNNDVREDFIAFVHLPRITGEVIAETIVSTLQGLGLEIENCALAHIRNVIDKLKRCCLYFHGSPKREDLSVLAPGLLCLVPSVLCDRAGPDLPNADEIINIFKDDLPSPELLRQERLRFQIRYSTKPKEDRPNTAAKALKECDDDLFPNISAPLKIYAPQFVQRAVNMKEVKDSLMKAPPTNFVVSPSTLSDWNVLLGEADKLILLKRFSNSKYDFHLWSDDSHKGGEERHIVGVHTWCPIESKPRAYVLANSLTAGGSRKHQSDMDYHVVKNEYDITNVSQLVGDNASTQKGKLAEHLLQRLPKSDSHHNILRDVIKTSSSPMIQVEIKFLFEFLDKFIIPSLNTSQASDAELGFSSDYLAWLWPATVLKHHETLSEMLKSPSEHFPLTSQQSIKANGHKLKLHWKASGKGTSALEGQRSFSPAVIEGVTSTPDGQVPRLMQLAALKVWNYGEELPIYDLPRECQLCLQNLPNVFQPPTTCLSRSHMTVHITPLPTHEE
ncbi:Zinc finger MYM-type protein 1 [Stylophora pistillata]|uniref:Zinc finger MYM-type protein 1 n=1 Tax=Stylophora pistillata TaxID=50429 RepID=A0A2B4S1M9_STYPI|nr:Zinc finger MYM-type protein 1 [Stylophora pistillata]